MNSNLAIPVSIVVAGAMIAGAVYFALAGSGGSGSTAGGTTTGAVEIRPVSADEHIRGSANADVAIVEFSDTECPFCKQFDGTMQQVIQDYSGDEVAWVYRHFPLEQLHPKAPKEAEAMECAWEQGGNDAFWAYSDIIYSRTNANNSLDIGVYNTPSPTPTAADGTPYYTETPPTSATDAGQLSDFARELGLDVAVFEECLASDRYAQKVAADVTDASGAGGNGTPFIVFASQDKLSRETRNLIDSLTAQVGQGVFVLSNDGYRVSMSGALPYDMVAQILDSMLK